MELDIQSIGTRIKERRKELKLTQLEIKERAGISSGNMSDIERGNRLPAAATLAQLSEILDCSIDWMLTGKSLEAEKIKLSCIGESDRRLLELFHGMSEEDQEELLMIAQMKYNRIKKDGKRTAKSSSSDQDEGTVETA